MAKFNEDSLAEQPVIEWFKELGYEYAYGPDIAPGGSFMERSDYKQIILEGRLTRSITRINPDIPQENIKQVVQKIMTFFHPDIELGNKEMYDLLTKGIITEVKDKDGNSKDKVVKIIDFENIDNNEFLVVNQYSIEGPERPRKPDVVIFINGIPVAVFELKNPTDKNATIVDAFAQLHETYKKDIPNIFFYNQIMVVSDLMKAKHGTVSSSWDYFSIWDGINDENEDNSDKTQLEVLTKGIFPKERLLDIMRFFIVFEADAEKDATKFTKKMCMYNQYFGVNRTIKNTLEAVNGNKKIGVFWHTQGSGKSLSTVFYSNKVTQMPELEGPLLLFLTDRNDLDDQLYKTFRRTGYSTAKEARSIKDLSEKLRNAGSELIFTTIQKFDFEKPINERKNIIVIADEAHRSQYAKKAGEVRVALPNASFLGITGTPIAFSDRNTQMTFGNIVSEYRMDRSEKDNMTVPIYYDSRLIPLHYANEYIDEDFDELFAEHPDDIRAELKRKFVELEKIVGADDRLRLIAKDILNHFNHREVEGKAMIVTMSRKVAVDLYNILMVLPQVPEIAVVISDSTEYKNMIQEERNNKELEKRFKNPEDPLKIVIVCDMWLTGFDVPHLNTLYLDKLIKGHTLMQAIARVNRRYKNKEAGLIVDYIGIADNLKKAIGIYTSDVQKQPLAPIEDLVGKMLQLYAEVKSYFSVEDIKSWKELSKTEQTRLLNKLVNDLITNKITGDIDSEKKKTFLQKSNHLFKLFKLIMPHEEAFNIRQEIEFFEKVKETMIKFTTVDPIYIERDTKLKVGELISQGIVAERVIKVSSSKESLNISVLDESFLQEAKSSKIKNLTVEAISKLLMDELRLKVKRNKARYVTLLERIEDAIEKYESNIINSNQLIEKLVEVAREVNNSEQQAKKLGLTDEEVTFYDTMSQGKRVIKEEDLKKLVREIVKSIRGDITIDWADHEVIKARIRANVRFALLRHNVEFEDLEPITAKIYDQALNMYRDFPFQFG